MDVNTLEFDYKKSTIEDLGKDVITKLEQKIPKHTTGYTDFLGNLYFSNNVDDALMNFSKVQNFGKVYNTKKTPANNK